MASGSTVTVRWETATEYDIAGVRLEFSVNDGESWNEIAVVPDTGAYEWNVPGVISESVLFKISDEEYPNVFDTSDTTFIVYECLSTNIADLNNDCYVNLEDVSILAINWLICGNPYDSVCDD